MNQKLRKFLEIIVSSSFSSMVSLMISILLLFSFLMPFLVSLSPFKANYQAVATYAYAQGMQDGSAPWSSSSHYLPSPVTSKKNGNTGSSLLLLDSNIRDWVLLPIILMTLLLGLCRHYVVLVLRGRGEVKMNSVKNAQIASYANALLANGFHLSPEGYKKRVELLCGSAGKGGLLRQKVEAMQLESLMDQGMMGEMMKNQMVFMLPNIAMMMLISYCYDGFIIAKAPFALPSTLKGMVQKGIEITDLDGSYVTSLSMYLMVMFGIQPILDLIIGGEAQGGEASNAMAMMSQGGTGGQGPPGQPVDYTKVFPQLREEIEFASDRYKWILESAPKVLVNKQ